MSAITLARGVHLVASGPLGISHPLDCHAYVIETVSGHMLVDAGVGLDMDRIVDNIRSLALDPRDVRLLLLTHAHADHGGGAGALSATTGAEVAGDARELRLLAEGTDEELGLRAAKRNGTYPGRLRLSAPSRRAAARRGLALRGAGRARHEPSRPRATPGGRAPTCSSGTATGRCSPATPCSWAASSACSTSRGRTPRTTGAASRRSAASPSTGCTWATTCGRSLSLLLGGGTLDAVPVTGLLTRGDAGVGVAPAGLPRALGEAGARIVSDGGFGALKLKGSPDAAFDVAVMGELRRALPGVALRVDPNAAWSVPAALRAARELEPLGLEYLEDPCSGLEGMARVRAATRTPLCTNMCVVRLEELAPAVRMGAVDVVHADVHKWGGIHATVAMRAVCQAFGLGVNLHSGGELGLSTACHLQVASALGLNDFAADSMYPLLADDVVAEPVGLREGALAVPSAPGLGVQVDMDKLRHYAARNAEEGDHTL